MKFVIITGISGAGKSKVVETLEDIGYFCVDNMPISFMSKFVEICSENMPELQNVAVVVDVRSGQNFGGLYDELFKLESLNIEYEILYLDASDEVIMRRYKESRRPHPLEQHYDIKTVIKREREILRPFYENSKNIIDTSNMSVSQLKKQVEAIFLEGKRSISITIMSFGYKYGNAEEADMVFDIRCLPNPFYEKDIRHLTGIDSKIQDYIFSYPQSVTYLEQIVNMLDFLLPHFIEQGKSSLTVATGCTGGKHRSVTFAEKLKNHFDAKGITVSLYHRDINKM